jgi:anti-anti-sigma regulatory factor
MNDAAARCTDRAFTLSLRPAGRETLLVALSGELAIEHVEELAACADQVCGLPARNIRLELSGLTGVDEPGARTLAAACQCLRLHGRRVSVRGIRREVGLVLDQLGLVLDERTGRAPDGGRRRPAAATLISGIPGDPDTRPTGGRVEAS